MNKKSPPSSQATFGQILSLKISVINTIGILGHQAKEAWRKKDREKAKALEKKRAELIDLTTELRQIEIKLRAQTPMAEKIKALNTISGDARRYLKAINRAKTTLKGAEDLIKLLTKLVGLFA